MEKIFYPESIAIVGLSSKANNIPRLTLENMLRDIAGACSASIPGGVDAFVDVVVRVSHLLHQFPQIKELDINPVRVFSQGAMALDCRMRVETS